MACINVSVQTFSPSIDVMLTTMRENLRVYNRTDEQVKASVSSVGKSIKATSSLKRDKLSVSAARLGERFKATVSIICSLAEFVAFLEVSPDEIQWITDDLGVYYEVKSNVEWIINVD